MNTRINSVDSNSNPTIGTALLTDETNPVTLELYPETEVRPLFARKSLVLASVLGAFLTVASMPTVISTSPSSAIWQPSDQVLQIRDTISLFSQLVGDSSTSGIASGIPASDTAGYYVLKVHKPQTAAGGDTDADFMKMAIDDPDRLLEIVETAAIRPSRLTFAAEAVGLINDSDAARNVLLPLLNSPSRIVREGAIYGLGNHVDDEVVLRLKRIAVEDPSQGVRRAAAELLDV